MVFSEELGLTPEQQRIMQEKDTAFRKSIKEIREEVIEKRRMLLNLLREDKPDRTAIGKLIDEMT
ncbi:MAG TPA: periplasmic heavy metal sensor [Thermodesulfovibrionales bacterium]|nr:periplasmic heavy metal sensor [Thermodesulfovibrionales bacterium]